MEVIRGRVGGTFVVCAAHYDRNERQFASSEEATTIKRAEEVGQLTAGHWGFTKVHATG